MNKFIFYILISIILLTSCQRERVYKTHGIAYLDKKEKLIQINKSNKNDAIIHLGLPATQGLADDNLWIYLERTRTRGKLLKMGRNYLKKNNVLVLEFDKYGLVSKKEFYDKNHMKKVKFTKVITENDLKKENFVYSFLSSIRQKMQSRRK